MEWIRYFLIWFISFLISWRLQHSIFEFDAIWCFFLNFNGIGFSRPFLVLSPIVTHSNIHWTLGHFGATSRIIFRISMAHSGCQTIFFLKKNILVENVYIAYNSWNMKILQLGMQDICKSIHGPLALDGAVARKSLKYYLFKILKIPFMG